VVTEPRAAVERARMLGPDIRKTLICNLQGKPFTESGFRANWHRLIQAASKGRKARNSVAALAPVLFEPFTIHDLRAKSASDDAFEDAHGRLAHDDPRTTQAIYRRKPRRASGPKGHLSFQNVDLFSTPNARKCMARGGIEPPTRGFSVPSSNRFKLLIALNKATSQCPIFP
jgi:hypothetical protein